MKEKKANSKQNQIKKSKINEQAQKQIRITDILYFIKKHMFLIIVCTVIGFIAGIGTSVVSYMRGEMSKQYAITSSIAVTSQNENGLFTASSSNPDSNDIYLAEEMVDSVIYVMKSDKLLNAAINHLNLIGVTTKDIYDNLEMTQYNGTQIIEMTLYWRSAQEGVEILNAISEVSADILIDTLKIGNVTLVNEPKSKYLIGGNINAGMWVYIAVLGAVFGIGLAILDLLLRPTLLESSDMEKYYSLEILGELPEKKDYFSKKVNILSNNEDNDEAFDITDNYVSIAHIIRHKVKKMENPCIYVTSASKNERKTTVTANLGFQLSEIGMKVLLIDFDTRNPMLGGLFVNKVDYEHSLNALYRGEIDSEDAITHLTGNLDILPAVLERKPLPLDEAVLEMVRNLESNYDIVLIDTAPVGQVAETMSLNRLADKAVVVVRFDGVPMDKIKDSIIRLEKTETEVLGCIINGVKNLGIGKKKYGYSYYGEAYGKKEKKSEQAKEWEDWERKTSEKSE